jgi:hypothetical protein
LGADHPYTNLLQEVSTEEDSTLLVASGLLWATKLQLDSELQAGDDGNGSTSIWRQLSGHLSSSGH